MFARNITIANMSKSKLYPYCSLSLFFSFSTRKFRNSLTLNRVAWALTAFHKRIWINLQFKLKQWMGEAKIYGGKKELKAKACMGTNTPSLHWKSTTYFSFLLSFVLSQNHNTKRKCKRLFYKHHIAYRKKNWNKESERMENKWRKKQYVWCFEKKVREEWNFWC